VLRALDGEPPADAVWNRIGASVEFFEKRLPHLQGIRVEHDLEEEIPSRGPPVVRSFPPILRVEDKAKAELIADCVYMLTPRAMLAVVNDPFSRDFRIIADKCAEALDPVSRMAGLIDSDFPAEGKSPSRFHFIERRSVWHRTPMSFYPQSTPRGAFFKMGLYLMEKGGSGSVRPGRISRSATMASAADVEWGAVEAFFYRAMLKGYAGEGHYVDVPEKPGHKRFVFPDREFLLVDEYGTNATRMSYGTTTIWVREVPVWTMWCGGKYSEPALSFLKQALREGYEKGSFSGCRGPESRIWDDGDVHYVNFFKGHFRSFEGDESVHSVEAGEVGYHWFHGGSLVSDEVMEEWIPR
jgi:hypothetical protein